MPRTFKAQSGSGLSPLAAGAIVGGLIAATALIGRRNAPDPSHPSIDRWYHRLSKPPFTPPDPVFGAAWPAIETALAYGGYRLLRKLAGAARNASVGLWLVNTGMIAGWSELFFRKRELGASAAAAGAMLASETIAAVTLSWSSTTSPIAHSRPISTHADFSDTRSLASGRSRVRSTCRSRSRSTMSL